MGKEELVILVVDLAIGIQIFGFRALQPLIERGNGRRHLAGGRDGSRRLCGRRSCRAGRLRACRGSLRSGGRRRQLRGEELVIRLVDFSIAVQILDLIASQPLVKGWNGRRDSSWRSGSRWLRACRRRLGSRWRLGACRRRLCSCGRCGRASRWIRRSRRLRAGWSCSRRSCSGWLSSGGRLRLGKEKLIILFVDLAIGVQVFGCSALQPLIQRWRARRHLSSRWHCACRRILTA